MDGFPTLFPTIFVGFALVTVIGGTPAGAVELTVMSGGAMRAALQELAPAFEISLGDKTVIEYSMVGKVEEKVAGDEPIDVAILSQPVFDKLVRSGRMLGGSATRLARVPIGMAVKNGTPQPDIGSVEAFKKTLLDARIVTYGDPGMGDAAGVHLAHLIEQFGLAAELKAKTRLNSPAPGLSGAEYLSGLFQRGEAEIAMAPISVLSETQGIDIVGLLPTELQSPDLTFVAGIAWRCRYPLEAKAFLDFLAGERGRAVYLAKGMQPD